MALVPLGLVTVKMLPFDNKSEFQVIVHMPEDTPLEHDRAASPRRSPHEVAAGRERRRTCRVMSALSSPYNFNGLVRHYFLRRGAHLADLQVNLASQGRPQRAEPRDRQARARSARADRQAVRRARSRWSEVPPGPPVLQTLVAEVYGPDATRRLALAGQVKSVFEQTPGVVDVDWYVESPQAEDRHSSLTTREKAPPPSRRRTYRLPSQMATDGRIVGLLHDANAREDVPIVLRLPRSAAGIAGRRARAAPGRRNLVAVGELTRDETRTETDSLYHKNLLPVTYVTGDVAGADRKPGLRDPAA